MSTVITSEEYKGFNIEIGYDPYPENPRTSFDPFGKLVICHSRYNFGDENVNDLNEHLLELADYNSDWLEQSSGKIFNGNPELFYMNEEILNTERILNRIEKSYIILPVYMYDHSGITIKTSPFGCRFDSGLVGYIYISKTEAKRLAEGWFKYSPKQVKTMLEGQIETLDTYLRGDVLYYKITDSEGNEIDSCYGFYDTEEYVLTEAKSVVDANLEGADKQQKLDIFQAWTDLQETDKVEYLPLEDYEIDSIRDGLNSGQTMQRELERVLAERELETATL
jgi:hypothetical protein